MWHSFSAIFLQQLISLLYILHYSGRSKYIDIEVREKNHQAIDIPTDNIEGGTSTIVSQGEPPKRIYKYFRFVKREVSTNYKVSSVLCRSILQTVLLLCF